MYALRSGEVYVRTKLNSPFRDTLIVSAGAADPMESKLSLYFSSCKLGLDLSLSSRLTLSAIKKI